MYTHTNTHTFTYRCSYLYVFIHIIHPSTVHTQYTYMCTCACKHRMQAPTLLASPHPTFKKCRIYIHPPPSQPLLCVHARKSIRTHRLQCVTMCCSVLRLQCVTMCCSVLRVFQRSDSVFGDLNPNVLQCATVCCSVLQCVAVCYMLQHAATHCTTLPLTNTLQHTVAH